MEETPEDFEKEIMSIAAQQNDSPRRVRAKLERNGQMDSLRNMIVEGKVIDLITDNATFTATEFKEGEENDQAAIDFFAGGSSTDIPEAKYAGGEEPAIPGLSEKT